MLSTRFTTAVVIAVPMLLLLFYLPPNWWRLLTALIMLVTSWELLRLAGFSFAHTAQAVVLWLLAALVIAVLLYLPWSWQRQLIHLACGGWLLMLGVIVHAQTSAATGRLNRTVKLLIALLFVVPTVIVVAAMQAISPWLLLALLSLVWAADVGAYFVGRSIGGMKMASRISPNKTVSGLAGGMLGATLVAAGWVWYLQLPNAALLIASGLVIALMSVAGDLLASLLKRQARRKDSSSLLPGHGGLVDRLDSLMAAAPFYALTVELLLYPLL
ncbi:MAG: phosphatidate cytidylyltransferase [Wenzhouxiangellaceae bacterium]